MADPGASCRIFSVHGSIVRATKSAWLAKSLRSPRRSSCARRNRWRPTAACSRPTNGASISASAGPTRPRRSRATTSRSNRATSCSSTANFVAPHSGKYFDSINPATEEKLTEIAEADAHDVDRAVQGGAARATTRSGAKCRDASGANILSHRAHHPGKSARTGRARNDGRRQDDQGKPRRGSAAGGRAFFLLRGLGGQAGIRVSRAQRRSRWAWRGRSFRGIFLC